jgi:hypothetical protein
MLLLVLRPTRICSYSFVKDGCCNAVLVAPCIRKHQASPKCVLYRRGLQQTQKPFVIKPVVQCLVHPTHLSVQTAGQKAAWFVSTIPSATSAP